MKKIKKFATGLMLIALTGCTTTLPTTTTVAETPPAVGVSFQFFYDNLSPYGAWVAYPDYGYVWIPRAAPGFRPYFSSGQWVFTDLGWTWVSYYDWGWAPFHYGSWQYDPFYGWFWVPGYNWAPAWVTWGYYDGYYGWAPLAPGISFSVGYYPPIDYWVFCPPRYINTSGWNNHYYVASQHRIAFDNNTAITNVRSINVVKNAGTYNGQQFSAGPPRAEFERTANTKVNAVSIRDNNTPGKARVSGDAVSVYRPRVEQDKASAKPAQVTPLEKMKLSDSRTNRAVEADKAKSRQGSESVAPATAPVRKDRATPAKQVAPEQRNTNVQPRQEMQKRNENVQPQQKARQPQAQPKSNVGSPQAAPQPQRNVERERVQPRQQQPVERKQAQPERIQRTQPREQQVAPERRQMERTMPQQPRYQPQQMPQRENRGRNNPK